MFKFDADNPLVDDGVWTKFRGSDFLIAHTSNLKFQRALSRAQHPHRKKLENGNLDPKINKDLICKAMSEGVLLGWKNVANTAGTVTEYSTANAYTALMKDTEFRDFVSEFSMNLTNFRKDELDDLGND